MLYGIAHWLLLGTLTLPFLVAPIVVWPWVVGVVPSVERSIPSLIAVLAVLSAIVILGRVVFLEYTVIRNQPLAIFQPFYLADWAALGLGLLVPRLAVPFLRRGVFTSGAG
jgi:hypothetical protein